LNASGNPPPPYWISLACVYGNQILPQVHCWSQRAISFNASPQTCVIPRRLWYSINSILHRNQTPKLPISQSYTSLGNSFASFFSDLIAKLHSHLLTNSSDANPLIKPPSKPPILTYLKPTSPDEILKLIMNSPEEQCDLDPIPTSFLKQCANALIPIITKIVTILNLAHFLTILKNCGHTTSQET
jgi:hypothetical protein